MSNDKKKQQKKKAREAKNKQQVVQRRNVKHSQEKELNDFRKMQKKFEKAEKDRERLEAWAETFLNKLSPEVREQVTQNISALAEMESEYESEISARKRLSLSLEAQGAESLEDKVNKLRILSNPKPETSEIEQSAQEASNQVLYADLARKAIEANSSLEPKT